MENERQDAANPEFELIDLLAGQIEDDEDLVEGLGSGVLSLGDVERWRQRRWEAERRFLQESGRLIAEMRRQGFGEMMRSSNLTRDRRRGSQLPRRARRTAQRAPEPPAREEPSFTLELADVGLPCTLRLSGAYDDVLDAGVWHARRVHRVAGSAASLRQALKSALVEEQTTLLSPEQRYGGLRSERLVSDESANRTGGSGFASA